MFLATAAAEDGEMRHFDAEQECLKADIDEEIYIEIHGESLDILGAVYWLVQVGRCWIIKFCDDSMAIGFEQSKSYIRVLRKVADEGVKMVVAVHVDDILVHSKDQVTIETFAAELGNKFKGKDMGGAKYYIDRMHDHKKPQNARMEARPTLIREVGGGDVRRPETKQGTSVFGGDNPLKSG